MLTISVKFDARFAIITLTALVLYIVYTVGVTEWRTSSAAKPTSSTRPRTARAVDRAA